MEILFKVFLSVLTLFFAIGSLLWIWRSQIDLKETARRLIKDSPAKFMDWIATRESTMVYQDGQVVGIVSGEVKESGGQIVFAELCDTEKLSQDLPIEYKRMILRIRQIGKRTGIMAAASPQGTTSKKAVLTDVICDRSPP